MISQNKCYTGGTGILVKRIFNSEANRKDLVTDGTLLQNVLYSAYKFINTVDFSPSLQATVLSLFILFGRMEFLRFLSLSCPHLDVSHPQLVWNWTVTQPELCKDLSLCAKPCKDPGSPHQFHGL